MNAHARLLAVAFNVTDGRLERVERLAFAKVEKTAHALELAMCLLHAVDLLEYFRMQCDILIVYIRMSRELVTYFVVCFRECIEQAKCKCLPICRVW